MAHHWEQVNAVHFCTRLGKTAVETQDLLLQAYQQEALRKGTSKAYYNRFKKGGNSFPDTYGRRSIGNVKNKSNRKEISDVIDSNSGGSESEGNGFPSSLDINLNLQWDNADSNDVDTNPSISEIKKFLRKIEVTCKESLKPQKLKISTNQDSVLDAEVDTTTLPEEIKESEPMQEVNEDSAMEDTVSSSFLNNGDGEIDDAIFSSQPTLETVEDTISSSLPSSETVEETKSSSLSVDEIVEDPISSSLPDTEEVEDVLNFSETTHETVEDTINTSPLPSEIVEEDTMEDTTATSPLPSEIDEEDTMEDSAATSPLPSEIVEEETLEDTTIPVEDVISFSLPIHEPVEESMSSILSTQETLEDIISSSVITDEICVTTKKTRRVSTPRKRKTRTNCRCPTCRLKF